MTLTNTIIPTYYLVHPNAKYVLKQSLVGFGGKVMPPSHHIKILIPWTQTLVRTPTFCSQPTGSLNLEFL